MLSNGFWLACECVYEREPRKKYVCFVYALSFVGFWFWIHIWYKILRAFSIPSSVIFVCYFLLLFLLPSSVIFAVFCRFFISFSSVCTSSSFICVPFGERVGENESPLRDSLAARFFENYVARAWFIVFFSSSSLFRFI